MISSVCAAQIDSDYGVGTSNINLFGPIASKLPYGTHYVYWREGQYVYSLAYSDTMELNGSRFSADQVTIVSYTTYAGYGGAQANLTSESERNFSLDAGNYLVWSDLGDYPTLYERGAVDYAKTTCIILCSFALYYLFHHLWSDIRQRWL